MNRIFRIFILLFFTSLSVFSQNYEKEYSSGNNYATAGFRLWVPKTDEALRAILVIVPGYNGDARDDVNDSVWQNFAVKNRLAILGCAFKDKEQPVIYYREASKGSGQVLLNAINELADDAGMPSLKELPLILMGFSAGGQFNYEFACWKPDKVVSFVVNKGGYYHTGIAPEQTRQIPALFFYGEKDAYYRRNMILGIFSVNRKLGANWSLVMEENIGHGIGNSIDLAIQYFESVLPLRLNNTGGLKKLDITTSYVGNWETKNSTLVKGKSKSNEFTIWLPDKHFAETWENLYK